MVKQKYKKRNILAISLASLLFLTNCGGGSSGPSNLPNKPTEKEASISYNNLIKGQKYYDDLVSSQGNETFADEKILEKREKNTVTIPKDNIKVDGHTQKIAILDSDFLMNQVPLEAIYPGIDILEKDPPSSPAIINDHGETVLEVMSKEEPQKLISFHIIAASIGDEDDRVKPSSKIYETVFEKFGDQKVKVFNQSWGTGGTTIRDDIFNTVPEKKLNILGSLAPKHGHDMFIEGEKILNFYKKAVINGGIFVWANGNQGPVNEILQDASLQAGLPYFYPDLESGWITAVGVSPIEGNRYNVHYEAENKLAIPGFHARWWAISASAKGYTHGEFYPVGSSYAAPRVSRAAALVTEKFPWMTNDQIRQTLFTTTDETNSLEQGKRSFNTMPSIEYGWGMLNEKRALKGPGAFLDINPFNYLVGSDIFSAKIPFGITSYFENDIIGDGGLEKLGKGTLHLTGRNSFEEGSIVTEGQLEIHNIHAGEVKVKPEGILVLHPKALIGYDADILDKSVDRKATPTGLKKEDITNEGIVKVLGNTAILSGDFIAKAGSTTEIRDTGMLTVLGTVKMEKGNIKVLSERYVSKQETTTVVNSKNAVGKIGNVEVDGMKTATAHLEGGKVIIEIGRQNAVEYLGEAEESSQNVAQNVEKVFVDLDQKIEDGVATASELAMGASVQTMSRARFLSSTKNLSGEIYASAQALSLSQAQNINKDLSNRLSTLEALSNTRKEWNGWVSAIGSDGRLQRKGYASADTKVLGGQMGIDKKVTDKTTLGFAFSYSHAQADFNRYAGESKSDMFGVSLYGKQNFTSDFYLAGRFGVSRLRTRVERELLDSTGNLVEGDIKHRDYMLSTYLEIGKKWSFITPFIGYSYDRLSRGSFSESNAAWGIHADRKDYTNHTFSVGLRAEYELEKYKMQAYVADGINVGSRDLSFYGHFTGSSVKQNYEGIKQPKHMTWLGLGAFREINPEFGIYGNVDLRFEDGKRGDAVLSTGLQYRF